MGSARPGLNPAMTPVANSCESSRPRLCLRAGDPSLPRFRPMDIEWRFATGASVGFGPAWGAFTVLRWEHPSSRSTHGRTQADRPLERWPSSAKIRCQSCQRNAAKWRDILTNPGKSRWVWEFISLYAERVRAFTNPATHRPVTPEVAGSSPVILASRYLCRTISG